MTKVIEGYNGVVHALVPQMLEIIAQVRGKGVEIPVAPQHTPTITVPSISYTSPVTHTYERRHKQPTPPITTLHVSSPFGVGTSSGGLGVLPSPTREETEPMSHDAPLPAGNAVGSAEGSGNLHELIDKCTTLEAKVQSLEDELKQTKQLYKDDLSKILKQMQTMQEEINTLKKKRAAHLVVSSPSSGHDGDSDRSSDDLGDSPKQGRKTDARTKGRKLEFEQGIDDFGGFDQPMN